ncbi:hypothetical protein TNCV_807451 [Trichonephila clavipes]|nr:hypothetical protein TNCV_807451 [Trichonephila clavipes]
MHSGSFLLRILFSSNKVVFHPTTIQICVPIWITVHQIIGLDEGPLLMMMMMMNVDFNGARANFGQATPKAPVE